jgi:tungstate transport system substrate-binding protein
MVRRVRLDRKLWLALILMLTVALAAAVLATTGCGGEEETTTTAASETTSVERSDLFLASTTSTQDSGLFDELIPAFEAAYPQYVVKVTAVGSGEAMKLGENKDADVLLVHSPAAEQEFMDNGYGTERRDVMYNDFIIVGPPDDPAGINGMTSAADAFAQIASSESQFFSRGDNSGTNAKELTIWKAAGIEPAGEWYQATGQGMGDTLTVSSEKQGYTLSDRATYLSLRDGLDLEILVEGDEALFNQYGVIVVVDATNEQGATDFMIWITSPDAQQLIGEFGVEKYGQPLFTPNAQ